ncbi:hypothetical protein SAMN05444156_1206 [Verrucomicrobium sp. GAS474]|uniref:hypothetical protein n=1 Tax=Verrucomicrobium sp. GAS474 TaxID=1882831 RepID=UPI00087BAA1F|nr:hypothetical protein [Verrucomicrobium sp. GAS474]SDT97765.1 hypothetical protein SAMN05444156_1206 [Verrucomicrobium sp. GAS474]
MSAPTLRYATSLVPATTRIYMEMGSVFAKQLANGSTFVVLSYQPDEGRIRAKTSTLKPEGRGPTYQLRTTHGVYEMGATQRLRLRDGRAVPIAEVQPGEEIHSCDIQNADGFIFIDTGKGLAALHDLIESDMQGIAAQLGIPQPSSYQPGIVQKVVSVTPGPDADLCLLSVDDPTTNADGHCFMLWPDGTSFGSGIFVY